MVADATPHGAYFYAEPREMIEGDVAVPRVFLHAAAVLERQFLAYCMDRWVRDAEGGALVPRRMSECLSNMKAGKRDPRRFPFNYLAFAKANLEGLFSDFLGLFAGYLDADEEAVAELRAFVVDGPDDSSRTFMAERVLEAFEHRSAERNKVREQVAELNRQIKELDARPGDSSWEKKRKDIVAERDALATVVKGINNEDVYGFLSRESLLPNYAFPEDGVNLRVIMRRPPEDDERADGQDGQGTRGGEGRGNEGARQRRNRSNKVKCEYTRASAVAMGDFAPGNTFYADGHHFQVDQVDVSTAQFETWRLCPSCSHAEQVTPQTPAAACPKCGDTMWEDKGQLRRMLRLHGVVSHCDYSESMNDDASDRRTSERYVRQLLVDIDGNDVVRAFRIRRDGYDFGYEYASKATMREINCGKAEGGVGEKSSVAGDERVRAGFKVCMKCGNIQIDENTELTHAYACPVRTGAVNEQDAVEQCLFLYREFETEALRLVIPEVTLPGGESQITQTFIALVMLGLRERFGNVDHLLTAVVEEPIEGVEYRKRYLVVYDSVPGGTGYLKQLVADEHAFTDVLEAARAALLTCSCNEDPQKDGCYHCLYAYRQSKDLGNISRRQALDILANLLDDQNTVEEVRGVAAVSANPWIQSKLEEMFIVALKASKTFDGRQVSVKDDVVRGKKGWYVVAGDLEWDMVPQVDLGPADGVAIECRPDFVLYPLGRAKGAGLKPVAVFTDGFQYHAAIADDDTAKREAVRRSGRYRVWSLSYDDVAAVCDPAKGGDYHLDVLNLNLYPRFGFYSVMGGGKHADMIGSMASVHPFDLLVRYLSVASAEVAFADEACAYAVAMTDNVFDESLVHDLCANRDAITGPGTTGGPAGDALFIDWRPSPAFLRVYGFVQPNATRLAPTMVAELRDANAQSDGYKKAWNSFWHLWNLMQFEPGFAAVSAKGVEADMYAALWAGLDVSDAADVSSEAMAADGSVAGVGDAAWVRALSGAYAEEHALTPQTVAFLRGLERVGVRAPDDPPGYDLESGEMAELVWEDAHVCYLEGDQAQDRAVFEAAGWIVMVDGEDNGAAITALREA